MVNWLPRNLIVLKPQTFISDSKYVFTLMGPRALLSVVPLGPQLMEVSFQHVLLWSPPRQEKGWDLHMGSWRLLPRSDTLLFSFLFHWLKQGWRPCLTWEVQAYPVSRWRRRMATTHHPLCPHHPVASASVQGVISPCLDSRPGCTPILYLS